MSDDAVLFAMFFATVMVMLVCMAAVEITRRDK